jgi:RNA polymerase sigma-70 factor (ECF subfamily)
LDDQTLHLIERAREDDSAALSDLFDRYAVPLQRALRRRIGDEYRVRIADSEDAAQDAILSALQGLSSFEYRGKGSFLAWLLKRAESQLLNRIRASRRAKRDPGHIGAIQEDVDIAADAISVSSQVSNEETRERVRQLVDGLPERERDVILLREYLGLSTEQVVVEMQLASASAARNLYSRARARLALSLSSEGMTDENGARS